MYLRTDEESEAAQALRMAARFAEELHRDHTMWRWFIIALHSAVQGFMVLSLRHGNGLMALTDKSAKQFLEAYEKGEPSPGKERLDSFPNLYEKIKSEAAGRYANNERFMGSADHDRAMKKLNTLRNEFIHFTPKGWSLELDGLPEISSRCLDVIEFIGWAPGNILWYEPENLEHSQLALHATRERLASLDRTYASFAS